MTLSEQLTQWVNLNKIVRVTFKRDRIKSVIVAKLIKYDEGTNNIITYDLDRKQVYNLALNELENIEED